MLHGSHPDDHNRKHNVAVRPSPSDDPQPYVVIPGIPRSVTMRVVMQKSRGRQYLYIINVLDLDTGENLMEKLRKRFNVWPSSSRIVKDRPVSLWKPVVEIATLSSISDLIQISSYLS